MSEISDLPIELLQCIFDDAASTFSPEWHWNPPTPSRALFPFNIASTCRLWLTVLKSKPEYWRQVVIDVADDPTLFLDTLSLFKTDGYDTVARIIIVFSSMKNSVSRASGGHDEAYIQKEAKSIENTRARAVFEHLEGSITHCGSITFDLVYQSSLPSSARICTHRLPLLRQLSLTCVIHDCDGKVAVDRRQPEFHPFLSLQSIAMTGVSFMEFCDCGPHHMSPLCELLLLDLSVDHFLFNSVKQVRRFQRALNRVKSYITLSLSDLTLTCAASTQPDLDILLNPRFGHIVFNSVSRDFLEEFMPTIFHGQDVQILTFQKCTIPYNDSWDLSEGAVFDFVQLLQFIDVPYKEDESSLFKAICSLTPQYVRFLRCDGLTDGLLKDMAGIECSSIQVLQLHECSGFNSRGVRAFIRARQGLQRHEQYNTLKALEVHGTGLLLSADDAAFFHEEFNEDSHNTRIEWNIVGHENIGEQ